MVSYNADVVGQMLLIAFFFGFLVCMVVIAITDWLGDIAGRYAARKVDDYNRRLNFQSDGGSEHG